MAEAMIMNQSGDDIELLGDGIGVTLDQIYDAASRSYLHFEPDVPRDLTGKGVVVAVVDTGVLSHHPDIRTRLLKTVDLTGEGPEDELGHGTLVTLLLLRVAPDVQIVSVKAIGRSGKATEARLIAAMDWIENEADVDVVNMSLGRYLITCKGDCSICSAARALGRLGKKVVAAAGNMPGLRACPAKADDWVFSVGAVDAATGTLAPYSSPAGNGGFVHPVPNPPTRWIQAPTG